MKKILYSLPAVLYCGAVLVSGMRLGFGGSLKPVTWLYMILLIFAAIVLCKKQWWGCIPGMAVGAVIIYLFINSHVHHPINETPIGIGVGIYYVLMGLICYKTSKKA